MPAQARAKELAGFQETLETMASPHLMEALASHDLQRLSTMVQVQTTRLSPRSTSRLLDRGATR